MRHRKDVITELGSLAEQLDVIRKYHKLENYKPTPKQAEFHAAGDEFRLRLLMAGNQTGKTYGAAMEVAMHMTGRYPEWWTGKRWARPVRAWAAGDTAETTRDNPQRLLLGEPELRQWGSETVPQNLLIGDPTLARSVPNAVDSFQVQHVSGGTSTLHFKNYAQGRQKWQGETLDIIWCDEEPPWDVYEEGLTRLNRHRGHLMITFTPLLGMTEVVTTYLEPEADDIGQKNRIVINMALDDATFYTAGEKEEIAGQYKEHMRKARAMGLPLLGEGLVYPVTDDAIACEPFEIPSYYRRIVGLDFGIDHPTAACWLAYDPDSDTVYVYATYKQRRETIEAHASALKRRGKWIPVAWPHDGLKSDPRSGEPLKELYRQEDVRMLGFSARYDDDKGGGQPREPIIENLLARMRSGRLKVFNTCQDWFREKNTYHRKDSKIVDYNDDLMSAMHYAAMMLRLARPNERGNLPSQALDYDPLNY